MQIQAMLAELKAMGFTQYKIAKAIKINQSTVCRAKNGSRISYENGKKIEQFYNTQKAALFMSENPPVLKATTNK